MNNIEIVFNELNYINKIDNYVLKIINIYDRFIISYDIYLRIPCITVNAIAKLSQLASDHPEYPCLSILLKKLTSIYSYSNGILLYVNNQSNKLISSCFYNPNSYTCLIHGECCKKKWKAFIEHEYPILYLTP